VGERVDRASHGGKQFCGGFQRVDEVGLGIQGAAVAREGVLEALAPVEQLAAQEVGAGQPRVEAECPVDAGKRGVRLP